MDIEIDKLKNNCNFCHPSLYTFGTCGIPEYNYRIPENKVYHACKHGTPYCGIYPHIQTFKYKHKL